jgi:hypothetical protein
MSSIKFFNAFWLYVFFILITLSAGNIAFNYIRLVQDKETNEFFSLMFFAVFIIADACYLIKSVLEDVE